MQVTLEHPLSGKRQTIDDGWSWSIFFGATFLGLPLFSRGLALWGTVMVVIWTLALALPFLSLGNGSEDADWAVTLIGAALSLYLGWRGNAMSIAHYLACGYELAEPSWRRAGRIAEDY